MKTKADVAIIVGSGSDLALVSETIKILDEFKLFYSVNIASAHRTAEHLKQCISRAESFGAKIFIAVAGMSAALPGVIASETIFPVIGVPVECKHLAGFDALLSISQMPKGVPVATVAVGEAGAINAAILAVQIIAVANDDLKVKLKSYKIKLAELVVKEDIKLQKDGFKKYITNISGLRKK
ncbi:MAG: 5-(carboxyamino)imidazole ribonucleotide mutase [Endomicrobium sp.]|jgi:phosphoribosylaminoimidazole carboxylase PurE protein|nr:5-(carboxyamino)imidazole ribonucleotide mutase [Endomicrobium sp.]